MSENKSLDNVLKKVDEAIAEDRAAVARRKRKKRNRRTVLVILLLIVAGILGINEGLKVTACKKLEANLPGMIFKDMDYMYELKLRDKANNLSYNFNGAKSNFVFNEDGTVTWTRRYNRGSRYDKAWTDPVTTTEKYTVKYLGNFIYDKSAIYVVLESGDVLTVGYSYKDATAEAERRPNKVDYSILHDENLNAPAALKDMDTSRVYSTKSSSSSSSSSKSSSKSSGQTALNTCPSCGKKVSRLIARKTKAGKTMNWCADCWNDYDKIIGK